MKLSQFCNVSVQLSVRGWLISIDRAMGIGIGLGSELKNRND